MMILLMKCYNAVVVSIDLIILMIWNKQQISMIRKICGQWTEQKNDGNAYRKYAVGTSNSTHPLLLLLLLLSFFAVYADVVGIKKALLHLYHIYNTQTCTVLKHTYYKIMINKEQYTKTRYKYFKRVKKTKICMPDETQ